MQRAWILTVLLLAAGVVGCRTTPTAPQASQSPGPLTLFNGKDLHGWQAYLAQHHLTKESVWSVQDGILICRGEPMGYLYTTQDFTDFKLVVEWRWAPGKQPGNSGILMRINGEPRPLPRCLECQLKSGRAGDLYAFHGMRLGGDPDRLRQIPNHELGGNLTGIPRVGDPEKPVGEWNRAEITVQGGRIQIVINGQKVNEGVDAEVVAGPIALQSEGGEIHFRRVEILPLPSSEQPLTRR